MILASAYIAKLEAALYAADRYRDAMAPLAHNPQQHQAEELLWNALCQVNFLAEKVEAEPVEEDELRSVMFK